jgi:hypothetical protein
MSLAADPAFLALDKGTGFALVARLAGTEFAELVFRVSNLLQFLVMSRALHGIAV